MVKRIIFSAFLFGCVMHVVAQEKGEQGNIVEIFGKERIEIVEEGEVVHAFKKGYYLKNTGSIDGIFYKNRDVIAWEVLNGDFKAPTLGNLEATNYGKTRQAIQWVPIEADSTGRFRKGSELRSAYLYGEYNAAKKEILLLQAAGNMNTLVNGLPREGDFYDFAYTLIPFEAKKGINEFIFTPGRYGRVEAKIIKPEKAVMLTVKDMTLSDIIIGESNEKWGAIRVINASKSKLKGLTIKCELESGESTTFETEDVLDMTTRKLPFLIPVTNSTKEGMIKATITLLNSKGKVIDNTEISIENVDGGKVHERTFRTKVDGSVQYYSVNPSTTKGDGQALFLSVHGASVEATNQARAYAPKDWGYIICPTNRRPFGYNWEDIGRIDAMEVLEEARRIFKTNPEKTYLTGHSMGGHGTWYLGATYPDKFAAIAPCASYPDIADYTRRGQKDIISEQYSVIERSANAGRTKSLMRNYLQSGIYILHGDDDTVVPIDLVREIRQDLAKFHPNVSWYEYPGGSHWYGNESVDWKPIFDYYKWHQIPTTKDVKHIEFITAAPGVSASNYWATISQQVEPYNFSNIILDIKGDSVVGKTENVSLLLLDFDNMPINGNVTIALDGADEFNVDGKGVVTLRKEGTKWVESKINSVEKSHIRDGNFKSVFDNNVLFVYSTKGSSVENEWYKNKARFDAETILYRGNGSVEVISDKEFLAGEFDGRNIVIYGNAKTNIAWKSLLGNSPIQIGSDAITFGDKVIAGDDLGAFFVYPNPNNSNTLVGVVGGTGIKGARAAFINDYLLANTGFPDVMIFNYNALRDGLKEMQITGFFSNKWDIANGDFYIK